MAKGKMLPVRGEQYAMIDNEDKIRVLMSDLKKIRQLAARFVSVGIPGEPFRIAKVVVFEEDTDL